MSDETLLINCNNCGGERVQHVRATHVVRRELEIHEGGWQASEATTYRTLQCGGCETASLREDYWYSEVDLNTTTYYPPHVTRKMPSWVYRLRPFFPETKQAEYMFKLFKEIYAAIEVEAYALAAMGVRAMLEHVMVSTVGDKGTFAKNLAAFTEAGHVTTRQQDRLEKILDVGNAAIHRAYMPGQSDVFTSLDIAEHVVSSIYIHDDDVATVSDRVPKRS